MLPLMESISIGSAAIKLTDKILGDNSDDLACILKAIASEIGLLHIAYMRFGTEKSSGASLLTAVVTYPREWQARYFLKKYLAIDPVIKHGRTALLPFDWGSLAGDDQASLDFFADAERHNVGRQGLSIPVRNRKNAYSLVSFTSDAPRLEWESFKRDNITVLQHLSALIDSAASTNSKLPAAAVHLSRREEQCLIWAARGKTHQEIAEILGLGPGSVKTHLDTARHKLHCINLTHAVGVAVATGVIPVTALRDRDSLKP
jgi:DNA-binding CsgD family transcriptional regulator